MASTGSAAAVEVRPQPVRLGLVRRPDQAERSPGAATCTNAPACNPSETRAPASNPSTTPTRETNRNVCAAQCALDDFITLEWKFANFTAFQRGFVYPRPSPEVLLGLVLLRVRGRALAWVSSFPAGGGSAEA